MVGLKQLIGDGRDMKKLISISISYSDEGEGSYILKSESKQITKISRDTLILKAKDLYDNLFADVKKDDKINITLVNNINNQEKPEILKQANTLYSIIETLLSEISKEINEL